MKLYIKSNDEALMRLADNSTLPLEEVGQTIVNKLIALGVLPLHKDACGTTMGEEWRDWFGDLDLGQIVGLLHEAGIQHPTCRDIDMLLAVRFIGDGDCPVCGAEMELANADTRRVGGDGITSPFEWETIYSEYVCPTCGHIRKGESE